MSVETFIGILVISASATSIGIEIIKTLIKNLFKKDANSTIVAVVVAFIVGVVEVFIYAAQGNMPINNYMTYILAFSMGIVNVVGCTTGYDIVKKFIYALFGNIDKVKGEEN